MAAKNKHHIKLGAAARALLAFVSVFALGTAHANAATTDTLATTGTLTTISAVAAGVGFVALVFIYRDYRHHRKPLAAVDPDVNYSFMHHIQVVTIPVFRYRLSIKITPKTSLDTKNSDPNGLRKF